MLMAGKIKFMHHLRGAERITLEEEMQERIFTHEDGPCAVSDDGQIMYLAKVITNALPWQTVIYLDGDPLNNQDNNLLVVPTEQLENMFEVPRARNIRWPRNRNRRD